MKLYSFFLIFSFIFSLIQSLNGLINALTNRNLPIPADAIDLVTSNVDSAQLPVKIPLPPIGTTSCSTYPHANVSVGHFQQMCYTQMNLQVLESSFPYKCRKNQFKVDLTLTNVPFQLPSVVGFTPQAGYCSVDYVSTTNGSHFYYNFTFVEAQRAEPILYVVNGVNLTVAVVSVIPHYTDKGYVFMGCPLNDLKQPLCSSPQHVFVCTYAQFPVDPTDVDDLVAPLNDYPYYLGHSLYKMDQTGC